MATNVEPPRPGAVGGAAAAAGTAPSTTPTAGISKKEPIGKQLGRHRFKSSQGKVRVIGDSWGLHFTRRCESSNLHQSLGFVGMELGAAVGIFRC